jgi:hypothetical protein
MKITFYIVDRQETPVDLPTVNNEIEPHGGDQRRALYLGKSKILLLTFFKQNNGPGILY